MTVDQWIGVGVLLCLTWILTQAVDDGLADRSPSEPPPFD